MTDREAFRLAVECIQEVMKPLAWDANMASRDKNAPPGMVARRDKYRKLAQALMIIEGKARQERMIP